MAFDETLVIETARDGARDDGPDARAADEIDLEADFAQPLDHADVGETARATPRQHHADRAARQQPCDTVDVATRAYMVVHRDALVPCLPCQCALASTAAALEQHQLDPLREPIGLEPGPEETGGIELRRALGQRDEHYIGLAHALRAPGRGVVVCEVDGEVAAGLDLAETVARRIAHGLAGQKLGLTELAERLRQRIGKALRV